MALQSIVAIATTTVQSLSNEVVFSSIPTIYRDLIIVIDGTMTANSDGFVRFNSDSGNNYNSVIAVGQASGPFAATEVNANRALIGYAPANSRRTQIVQIVDYSATNKHKTLLSRTNSVDNNVGMFAARWSGMAAVNTVLVSGTGGNFSVGTVVSLYGRIA